jgi:hypothetical protein
MSARLRIGARSPAPSFNATPPRSRPPSLVFYWEGLRAPKASPPEALGGGDDTIVNDHFWFARRHPAQGLRRPHGGLSE